jgi:periplasmic copper chaperone A
MARQLAGRIGLISNCSAHRRCLLVSSTFVLFCAVAGLLAPSALAHGHEQGNLAVRHPWTRATAPGAKVAAGYMEIRNSGTLVDRVIGASSPVAERVELHVMKLDGDVMRMREVSAFDVPARQRLELRPGSSHLMLVGIRKPLVKGERVPLTLRFERAGELQLELEVQAADSRKAHH